MARRARLLLICTLALAALVACGCGSSGPGAPPSAAGSSAPPALPTLTGSVEFPGLHYFGASGEQHTQWDVDPNVPSFCGGKGSYADLRPGTNALLRDEAGTILGKDSMKDETPSGTLRCHLTFKIAGIPTAKFYSLKIGSWGGPTWSPEELQAKGWTVALHLQ